MWPMGLLFADELVLISESPSGLQLCLNALEKYCTDWKLQVNMDKTKAMVFSKKSSVKDFYGFYYMHNIVPIVDQYKYLGLVFTSNRNLLFASEQLSERAKMAYYALKSSIPGNNNLSVQILLKLYQSMIIPIITYESEIWITEYKLDIKSSYCFYLW